MDPELHMPTVSPSGFRWALTPAHRGPCLSHSQQPVCTGQTPFDFRLFILVLISLSLSFFVFGFTTECLFGSKGNGWSNLLCLLAFPPSSCRLVVISQLYIPVASSSVRLLASKTWRRRWNRRSRETEREIGVVGFCTRSSRAAPRLAQRSELLYCT